MAGVVEDEQRKMVWTTAIDSVTAEAATADVSITLATVRLVANLPPGCTTPAALCGGGCRRIPHWVVFFEKDVTSIEVQWF